MEYGSDLLGLEKIQLMTCGQRGLVASMRWRAWGNNGIPREPELLARVLGLNVEDVRANLAESVLSFFEPDPNDPTRLICPELAAQMKKMMDRREKQVLDGSEGGKKARNNRIQAVGTQVGTQAGSNVRPLPVSEVKRDELKGNASSREGQLPTPRKDEWTQDYERGEQSNLQTGVHVR